MDVFLSIMLEKHKYVLVSCYNMNIGAGGFCATQERMHIIDVIIIAIQSGAYEIFQSMYFMKQQGLRALLLARSLRDDMDVGVVSLWGVLSGRKACVRMNACMVRCLIDSGRAPGLSRF